MKSPHNRQHSAFRRLFRAPALSLAERNIQDLRMEIAQLHAENDALARRIEKAECLTMGSISRICPPVPQITADTSFDVPRARGA